ncbi:hypothetical protein C5Y96_05840 [Blastopirellula marina]|uniref:Uncharacterized protein n=1 Tax=Blastopirellula marina TaxID=124 RepID=A0A2S8G4K3_9BACT|nr:MULTISPECIES: hypothetical protein [Pirellulaceae]PQO39375.1 hypothetical protein C5Y96_05840 [Blastopirellula marina]RCS55683.1 hypothetical protein DTL36_05850 [Bremerella cremea]
MNVQQIETGLPCEQWAAEKFLSHQAERDVRQFDYSFAPGVITIRSEGSEALEVAVQLGRYLEGFLDGMAAAMRNEANGTYRVESRPGDESYNAAVAWKVTEGAI